MRQFAEFLGSLSRETLTRRFDPHRMTALQISGGIWDAADARLDQLLSSYEDLRSFVDRTVEANAGLVVYVT